MPKHYKVVKMIVCDITGQQCGATIPIRDKFYQCCDYCQDFNEFKKSGMTIEEWKEYIQKQFEEEF